MKTYLAIFCLIATLSTLLISGATCSEVPEADDVEVDGQELEYAKGSVCGYCEYCTFCKLCDEDCPCEVSPTKPNCKMCKYCKYCYLCKACDVICQPGGILDTVSAGLVSSITSIKESYNKEEVERDIDSVRPWLDKKKQEL